MPKPLIVEQSRVVDVPVEEAFDQTLPIELPRLFRRWYGPIPPIKAVRDQTGAWATVGQTRTVDLTAAGSMREVLTGVDRPRSFGYRLSEVRGPLAPLVDHVDGLWLFEPAGVGTRVTWRWTVHPRSAVVALVMPVFGRLWLGYARRSLDELAALLRR